jgi:hypothetical protein
VIAGNFQHLFGKGLGHISGSTPTLLKGLGHILGRTPTVMMGSCGSSQADAGPVYVIRPVYSEWLVPLLKTLQISQKVRREFATALLLKI